MKNIIIRLFAVLAAVTIAAGCIEETFPTGSTITSEQLDASPNALQYLVNGIPSAMMASGTAGYASSYGYHADFGLPAIHLMTESMLEDFTISGQLGYFWLGAFFQNVAMGADYIYCSYFWDCYYAWIKAVNDVIVRAGVVDEETDPTILSALGQAYAYRAMCYLDLARLYEPKQNLYVPVDMALEGLTVPKVTEKTTPSEAADNRRMHREDMYEFILNDLSVAEKCFAAAAMPESVTRPSLYGVYGLFARAYMEMAYWGPEIDKEACGKVVEYADKVIAAFTPLNETQWHDPSNGFNRSASNSAWVWALSLDSSMTNNLFNFTAMMSPEAQFSYAQFTMPGINAWLYEQMPDAGFRKSSWYRSGSGLDYKYAGTLEDAAQTKLYAREYMSLKKIKFYDIINSPINKNLLNGGKW